VVGKKAVDGVTEGEIGSETEQKGFFINMATVLPGPGRHGIPQETFSGSADASRHPSRVPKRSRRQDRRIIWGNFRRS